MDHPTRQALPLYTNALFHANGTDFAGLADSSHERCRRPPDGAVAARWFWLRWVNDSYFTVVLQAGIRVFTYNAGFLHSKCAVADDDWCTVGSSNMDFRSFENNFEANAFIYGKKAATSVKEIS